MPLTRNFPRLWCNFTLILQKVLQDRSIKCQGAGTRFSHSSRRLHSSKWKWGPQVDCGSWRLLSGPKTQRTISLQRCGVQVSYSQEDLPSASIQQSITGSRVLLGWWLISSLPPRLEWFGVVPVQPKCTSLNSIFFLKIAYSCLSPPSHVAGRNKIIYVQCFELLGKAALSKCMILIIAIFLLPRRQAESIFHVSF